MVACFGKLCLLGEEGALPPPKVTAKKPLLTQQQCLTGMPYIKIIEIIFCYQDTWREVAIGTEAVLYNIRACPRCPMIYVDYQKHEMRANKEPMTTLLK